METGLGIPNPLFFMGVVENNDDPRLEGRVQVRAFGVHGKISDIPSEDLPWATCIMGNHDPVNVRVPPLNSWVFGFFIDGRDAQQPMILGVIPTQIIEPNDPVVSGWGVALGNEIDRGAHGSREQDFGQPPGSRVSRGEELERTYLLPLETNRVQNIEIAGGFANIASMGNMGAASQDDSNIGPSAGATGALPAGVEIYGQLAFDAAIRYGVPPDLFFRLVEQESSWNPRARSPVGAFGLTQIKPSTAADPGFGISPAPVGWQEDPAAQLNFGADYLITMYERYGGSWPLALAAYNAGPGTVDNAGNQIPNNDETPPYVNRIHGGWLGAGAPLNTLSSRYAGVLGLETQLPTGGPGTFPVAGAPTAGELPLGGPGTFPVAGAAPPPPSPGGSAQQTVWEEPAAAYNAVYPYNRVIETPGGHTIEIDSTQNQERIMIWHPSGSYIQMAPQTNTHKSMNDMYSINEKNYHMYIGGTNVITIEGDSHVLVKGNKVEEIRGDYRQIVHGNHSVGVAGQMNFVGGENGQIRAGSLNLESNVEHLHIRTSKSIKLQSKDLHFKADENVFMEGIVGVNIKGGETVKIGSADSISVLSAVVIVDDIVQLAGGGAESPEPAEDAVGSQAPAPPGRDIPLFGAQ